MKRPYLLCAALVGGAILSSVQTAFGQDVWSYSVEKGAVYTQAGTTAPALISGSPYNFRAIVEGDIFESIIGVGLQRPGAAYVDLDMDESFSVLENKASFSSLAALNSHATAGAYTFVFETVNDDTTVAVMNLGSAALPTAIPQISNLAAAQQINAASDFNLTFNSFGTVDGTEHWEFQILEDGFEILSDMGTGGFVPIPGEALLSNSTYEARLRFVREGVRDSTSYPGAIGTIELYNETRFTIATGGGGGGNDTTAPALLLTSPASGDVNVGVQTPVFFIFNEPMAATHSIEWSANVNAANFNYTWVNNGEVLVATYLPGFPANSSIAWKLNPAAGAAANFRDAAGNALAVNQFQGSFSTGASNEPEPCEQGSDDGQGSGAIFKSLNFVQTGNAAPVPDTELAATFGAFFRAGTNQSITAASLASPTGTMNLHNLFGNFMTNGTFSTAAALETAFTSGNYTLTVTGTGGGSVTFPLGNPAQIPVPRIVNLGELSSMNLTQNFTLNFSAFTGASTTDGIFIEISGDEGQGEFRAPDPCVPRTLPNNATSIVIPANTFKSGQTYRGSISFSKGTFNNTAIPNTVVSAGASVRTSFEFTIGGTSTPQQPMWSSIVRNQDGTLTFTIHGETGLNVLIEGSDVSNGGWAQVSSAVLTTGSHQITIDPRLATAKFFRARVL
jgi:hypothetical protein